MSLTVTEIQATDYTPYIKLDPEGIILITGRATGLTDNTFAGKIDEWLNEYVMYNPGKTRVIISLDYLNSQWQMFLSNLLKKLVSSAAEPGQIEVVWHYEADDLDILERGEFLALSLNIKIRFLRTGSEKQL